MPQSLAVTRRFTTEDESVWDGIELELRDVVLGKFEQKGVEVPKSWSQNATNIVAQKYFRGKIGSPTRERSARQMIDRVAETITSWGSQQGYFQGYEAEAFCDELTYILAHQYAAFNSPVWFNVGFEEHPQCSACFILSVNDTMDSILDWNTKEGNIFLGGSGSGVNLSKIRGSNEQLSKGGTASGPVSFMRGADSWAGTIKSGGKTRRAAKMVILDADHPDIEEFIWCKAKEEKKAQVLAAAGFSGGMEGEVLQSIQYQNANNSVRVTDGFMHAVVSDGDWALKNRNDDGIRIVKARKLFEDMCEAQWQCADPGIQFDSTINDMHTCPESGRINASNPCSEYMHVDDSACNLASLNLMKFRKADGSFDIDTYKHVINVMFMAQDMLINMSSYPTEEIGVNARAFRQLGLGYANLGAYLMSKGMAYDSDEARHEAACLTAILTGQAYLMSGCLAEAMGPYEHYELNKNAHIGVIKKHLDSSCKLNYEAGDTLSAEAELVWHEALRQGTLHGFRNAQATVMAPTGTISFLMDCDTTGMEPDFALVKTKNLVGGGTMEIINSTVPLALASLGYSQDDVLRMVEVIRVQGDATNVVKDEHRPVFDCANDISPLGHVRMMGAIQPFISGAISKTVNMHNDATAHDIANVTMEAWKLGVKAMAIYRDGSKGTQALVTKSTEPKVQNDVVNAPARRRLPATRSSITHKFDISGHEGYITAGMFDDGTLGEVFVNVGKEGSTIAGLLDFAATLLSVSLQYGVPLEDLAGKFHNMKFEPSGLTANSEIRATTSLPDYIVRWLASHFLDVDAQEQLGVLTPEVKQRKMDALAVEAEHVMEPAIEHKTKVTNMDGICGSCGGITVKTGTCSTCTVCGTTGGCG